MADTGTGITQAQIDWAAAFCDLSIPGASTSGAGGGKSGITAASSGSAVDTLEDAARAVGISDHTITVAETDVNIGLGHIDDAVAAGQDLVAQAGGKVADAIYSGLNTAESGLEDVKNKVTKFLTGQDPPAKPAGPLTFTHQTEATSPGNRARVKLGIGEPVVLTVTPGPGMWEAPGASLSSRKGNQVTMTAPGRPGEIEVTVKVGDQTTSVKFTVIAPSEVHQSVQAGSQQHAAPGDLPDGKPLPNAGFKSDIFIGPDDVSFAYIKWLEREVGATGTGSWSGKSGEGHFPNKTPLGMTKTIVSGKGTKADAFDHCWSGFIPGVPGPDYSGAATWKIPWIYVVGTSRGAIGDAPMILNTAADGTTTISKVGASFTTHLNDATFGF
jgi:hypothetical protein